MLTLSERVAALEKLVSAGRRDEALHIADEILTAHPNNASALNAKGALLLRDGKHADGERLVRAAAVIAPNDPAILANLAQLARIAGDDDEAVAKMRAAVEASGGASLYAVPLANILIARRELADAAELLEQAFRAEPDNASVLTAIARLEWGRGHAGKALALLEQGLETDADDSETLLAIAELHLELDEPEKAVRYAERLHLDKPLDAAASVLLATCYLAAGSLRSAYDQAERAVKLFPDSEAATVTLARCRIALGDTGGAAALMAKRGMKATGSTAGRLRLLDVLCAAGMWDRARELADRLVGINTSETEAVALRQISALARLAQQRLDDAWPLFLPPAEGSAEHIRSLARQAVRIPADMPVADALVLVRYLDRIAGKDAVNLSVSEVLAPLMSRLNSASQVVLHVDTGPLAVAQTPTLTDAVAAVTPAEADGAAIPYLMASQEGTAKWRAALAEFPRPWIGVNWEPRSPGLLIDHLAPVFDGLEATPVSLQFDDARHQLRGWPAAVDAGAALSGLDDLVDLVAVLDAVVAPNGLPVHIAGALGRPGMALLPANHRWYWAGEDGECLWYPTLRRVVKPAGPDWTAVQQPARAWIAEHAGENAE